MTIERCFLGWDGPVTAKVRDFLFPKNLSDPTDPGKDLIVVPTRHAGRRLRESLALRFAERRTALFPPRVVIPTHFFRPDDENQNVASPTEVWALWADVLMKADLNEHVGLFPARVPAQDFHWAVRTGQMIERLRDELADGGYRIGDVLRDFQETLEELDRWQDLATLESAYFERMAELGKQDPIDVMIQRAAAPEILLGIKRIIIAAVPDPTPLMIRALDRLKDKVPILILIHAPESMSDYFDEWGRPIPEKWGKARFDIPNPEANALLAGSPASQSHKVIELIASEAHRFGPADIAVGVPPDASVTPFLAADLESHGLPPFDPSGKPVREHPLFHLLDAYHALVTQGTYSTFSAFLRHADVLDFLTKKLGTKPAHLLTELDTFQNQYLPTAFEDISRHLGTETRGFPNLQKASLWVRDQVEGFQTKGLVAALRSFLQTVYQVRTLRPGNPEDEAFTAVAEILDSALREVEECIATLKIERPHALELLMERVGSQRYFTEHEGTLVDLEGWLELPWNDAPFLLVTGMNEGSVPDSRIDDVFLPDSLRSQLGLRHDGDRLAIDAFLMRGLIESRRAEGRIVFIAGKTSAAGDPLKPSRLLFLCDDGELTERAKRLFGDPDEKRDNHPASVSFLLDTAPPRDLPPDNLNIGKLSVTAFKDYLACPFRFYLKHVLGMEEIDDEKTELDAMDFGSLVHHALQRMAQSERMSSSEDEREITRFLHSETEVWVREHFGESAPLPVQIQLDAARSRLAAAARVQAQLVREGWRTLRSELRVRAQLNGITVSGRIDRIDRNLKTGHLQILDYKTSDRATSPDESHVRPASPDAPDYARVSLGGKERRWADLQLPLYRILLPREEAFQGGPVEIGYFNLPKAIGDTGVTVWGDFTSELLESARRCAEGIITDILNRKFWPPAARVPFDDFERLFPADVPKCIDVKSFDAFMGR